MARAHSAPRQLIWRILFERSERSERSELCAWAMNPSTAGQPPRSGGRLSRTPHSAQTPLCRHCASNPQPDLHPPSKIRTAQVIPQVTAPTTALQSKYGLVRFAQTTTDSPPSSQQHTPTRIRTHK